MKKIVLLLIIVTLCFSAKAEETDTCKIDVKRTEKGFEVSALSKKVFVRQAYNSDPKANNSDPKNYVFLTDTLVEILCKDSIVIKLQDCHQEGKVTCWSQKPGKAAEQDKGPTHQLAPVERRNWLKFNSMNASTEVEMVIIADDGKSEKLNFRQCGGWTGEQLRLSYIINGKGDNDKEIKPDDSDIMTTSAVKLKADDTFQKFTLSRTDKKRNMVVTKVFFDQTEIPFSVYNVNDKTSPFLSDDIMYDTEIVPDTLLNKQLEGGTHHISYVYTVLTQDGPKEKRLNIPIEVESESNLIGIIFSILGTFIVLVILVLACLFIRKKWKQHVKKIRKNEVNGSKLVKHEDNFSQPVANDNQQNVSSLSTKSNEAIEPSSNPDEEILNLLKKQFGTEDKAEIIKKLKKNKDLKKEIINSIITQWNTDHQENPVDISQMNINSYLNTIAKGYISPKGKELLEKYADEYQVWDDELIGAKSIENLHIAIYNRGLTDGAVSTKGTKNDSDQRVEILNNQIKELSSEKTKLEKLYGNLEKKYNELQGINQKSQEYVKKINEDNERLINTNDDQNKKIAELQQLVNDQSQEHVSLLEENIAELKKEIAAAQETIRQKADAIADEKENVRELTIQKGNLDNKYNTLKKEYDKVDGKHQEEIIKLKDAHKEANLRQKEKFEAQLKDKDEEIAKIQSAHKTALNDQKEEYEAKLTKQQEESKAVLKKKEEEYRKALDKLKKDQEAKVAKLNATIKELGASVNVGRDQTIGDAEKLLETIAADLGNIKNSVKAVVNQTPIFVNSINNIFSELQRTQEEFNDYKEDDWSKPEKLQAQVIADMQDIFINALNRSGWMNNVARLLSYSRLPKLHDGTPDGIDLPSKLEAHGISTAVLERIYANMVNLLGIANMGILIPAVLANNFDKENYEYKNGDTWIDKFFPEVSTRNYKGKVFDIVQVGYTVEGVTEKRPVVQYN